MPNCVEVDIHQLIIGREISFPIHDLNGVLLLAAGSTFTREFKMKIIERGISKVLIDEADAKNVMLRKKDYAPKWDPGRELNERVAEKLESLVRSGAMNVRNSGASLSKSVIRHGRKNYDAKQHKQLSEQLDQSNGAVDKMIYDVLDGNEVNGSQVSDVTDDFISSLTADLSQTLSVGFMKNQDPTLAKHSLNVAMLGMAIGIEMGLDKANVRLIGIAGLVQDLGMAFVPKHIRDAARPLSPVEFLEIQKHPIRSANILEKMPGIPDLVTLIAYQSHERPDGSGYPRRRDKKNIHVFARILQVADTYTAMTSPRPQRPPLMAYAAMETLVRQARKWRVDPPVVRNLLHVLSLFPIGSFVTLSDGSVAQVIRSNGEEFTRPIVVRIQDKDGNKTDAESDSAVIDLCKSDLKVVQALPTPGRDELRLQNEPAGQSA